MRLTIVHVIDSLGSGGAELSLAELSQELGRQHDLILVTLTDHVEIPLEKFCFREAHCLHYAGMKSLPACALRLNRIIRRVRPDLVRSQLYLSTLVARLATPKATPLISSIHSRMSDDSYAASRTTLLLDKLTYKKRHNLIGVSKDVLEDFDRWVGIKGEAYLLYNFVRPGFFERPRVKAALGSPLRLVAVGNLKEAKNYGYLIEALKLTDGDVTLDIYGSGPLRADLQLRIDQAGLPISLKGKRVDIESVLPDYDAYVMCSSHEGFGIAAVEAMAVGLPVLLSDLPVLREVSRGNAIFFDPTDPRSFLDALNRLRHEDADVAVMARKGIALARANYAKEAHLERLNSIYGAVVAGGAGKTASSGLTAR